MRYLYAVIVVMLAACAHAEPAGARYELASVDGRPVPALRDDEPSLAVGAARCFDSLLAEGYDLEPYRGPAEARYRRRTRTAWGCGPYVEYAEAADSGTYHVRNDTLRFRPAPDTFIMWVGTVRGDTLTVREDHRGVDFVHGAHTYRYVRR